MPAGIRMPRPPQQTQQMVDDLRARQLQWRAQRPPQSAQPAQSAALQPGSSGPGAAAPGALAADAFIRRMAELAAEQRRQHVAELAAAAELATEQRHFAELSAEQQRQRFAELPADQQLQLFVMLSAEQQHQRCEELRAALETLRRKLAIAASAYDTRLQEISLLRISAEQRHSLIKGRDMAVLKAQAQVNLAERQLMKLGLCLTAAGEAEPAGGSSATAAGEPEPPGGGSSSSSSSSSSDDDDEVRHIMARIQHPQYSKPLNSL